MNVRLMSVRSALAVLIALTLMALLMNLAWDLTAPWLFPTMAVAGAGWMQLARPFPVWTSSRPAVQAVRWHGGPVCSTRGAAPDTVRWDHGRVAVPPRDRGIIRVVAASRTHAQGAPAQLLSMRFGWRLIPPGTPPPANRYMASRARAGPGLPRVTQLPGQYYMKIQPRKVKQGLPRDQIVMAEIVKVTYEPAEGTPQDCLLHWRCPAWKNPIIQRLPAALEGNSPLAKVIATVRKKALTPEELEKGYDPAELIGSKSPVFATTRPGPGGKLVSDIGEVFDLAMLKSDVAALEVQPPAKSGQPSSEAPATE